ncbi:MAG: CysB family HTH-type transcriptional regulator [Tepidimonas sp.]|uniref:CysB family HTH-type transcriptional regulator n=1 Tax=Tepidimonas sp. TaxID=2002775 RepID=UPI00259EE157|nr:CysB family HTH-type transcriptional regulator [Tepidimonas sp.]MDM7455762.1 CysB family HTH-type transcriptional regulator [Tepidimonas sp.]
MNLHQFRFVQEAVRRNLNLTEAAKALHTSQPGVSKAILELEDELGIDIFARHGKRIKRLTEPGRQVVRSIEIILREVQNLKRIGEHYAAQDSGTLSIATTHTQARYVLPAPVARLRQAFPKVNISLHQGSPDQVARWVLEDSADIGIATESLSHDDLVTLPCYEWQHMLVMPPSHPLLERERIGLEDLAAHPLITYHPTFTGRTRIDQAFAQRGLAPQIVLEAIDSDVIKTYVKLGMGVGIVAEMAVQGEERTPDLVARPAGHLFGQNVARVAFKRGAYLRQFVLRFAEFLSDRLSRDLIVRAMEGGGHDYQL